jgi:SUKH-4 immunity protein
VDVAAVPPFFWPLGAGVEPEGRPPGSIGHDGGIHFVAGRDGVVVGRDPAAVRPDQYVNLSTSQFAASLQIFAQEWRWRSSLSESEANIQAEGLLRALAAVDPTAFVDGTAGGAP